MRLGLEVASGLAAAHAAGVLHRDVKPENVLLDAHDHAVLCDFGLAKALDPELESLELTHSHAVLGTLGYMAPEQALAAEVSPRTDVYGLERAALQPARRAPPAAARSPPPSCSRPCSSRRCPCAACARTCPGRWRP
ncbi:MAG: protein kinase [Planctomycetota bacterium]